jgi:hypothetical protein
MTAPIWFDDLPVLGKLPPAQAAAKLREVGENKIADTIEAAKDTKDFQTFGALSRFLPFQNRQWQHTAHAFGYITPSPPGSEPLTIRHAGNIEADPTLRNSRTKISLDRLRVADYPGGGTHRILFDFYAQNQVSSGIEHLHFNATYRVRENEEAAIIGYPIFVGLNVGIEGVVFRCLTVNVKNEDDEALLGFLESDVFKSGLMLATTAQPAIAPLSSMAIALTKSIARRHKNVPVQEFYIGLDFTKMPFRARLAEGSYIAVQIPEAFERVWDWDEWVYHPKSGQVVSRDDEAKLIPYNYLVFSVSRYVGD